MTAETGNKPKKIWLKAAIFGVLLMLAAGAGMATRWQQSKNEPPKPAAGAPSVVTDLERLRDSGDQAAYNAKLQAALQDASLDGETRYQVYVEQGHGAMQNQKFQAAIDAYLKAWEI